MRHLSMDCYFRWMYPNISSSSSTFLEESGMCIWICDCDHMNDDAQNDSSGLGSRLASPWYMWDASHILGIHGEATVYSLRGKFTSGVLVTDCSASRLESVHHTGPRQRHAFHLSAR